MRDKFFVLHVTLPSGFELKVPCRGYNLKSWKAFEDRLGSKYDVEEINERIYNHLMLGDPDECLSPLPVDTKSKTPKSATKQPRKSGPSTKKVGVKSSPTKPSAKTATKTIKKPTPSSSPKPKSSTGSRTRKTK
jgi:hypothetical protein